MTERNPDTGGQGDEHEPTLPADEEAAWAGIVAAYGAEPDDDPADADAGSQSGREHGEDDRGDEPSGDAGRDGSAGRDSGAVRSFTVYAAGTGPRNWVAPEDEDEGHFVPPEPPPLPQTDPTTRFAWLAVLGGPLLLFGAVLFRVDMTWWIVTLGVGGFLGGFGTLVARMRDGRDDDFDDPGRGAVV